MDGSYPLDSFGKFDMHEGGLLRGWKAGDGMSVENNESRVSRLFKNRTINNYASFNFVRLTESVGGFEGSWIRWVKDKVVIESNVKKGLILS